MKNILLPIWDIIKKLFHWRGRLSITGYWRARLIGFAIDLLWIGGIFMLVRPHMSVIRTCLFYIFLLWRIPHFIIFRFAAIKRYHDSGKPGWLALILDGLGYPLAIISVCLFILLFLLFGLGAPIENILPLILIWLISGILGGIFCIINIILLSRRSDPYDNAYGNPPDSSKKHSA